MDENIVRDRLRQVRDALAKVEREREVLLAMLAADERWLAWQSKNPAPTPFPGAIAFDEKIGVDADTEKRGPSLMQAALDVLKEARGTPLHAREIWKRAQEIGATSAADSPLAAVDFALFNLTKKRLIEKVGPRTFRIVDKDEEREPIPERAPLVLYTQR